MARDYREKTIEGQARKPSTAVGGTAFSTIPKRIAITGAHWVSVNGLKESDIAGSFAALVAHSALWDMQLRIRHEKPASPVHNKECMDEIVEDREQTAQR